MGYFSQRKKQARENMFMTVSLVLLAIIYALICLGNDANIIIRTLRGAQFHIYLFNLFLFLFVLIHRKFLYAVFACLLLLFNYNSIAKTARLFVNYSNDGVHSLNIIYQKNASDYHSFVNSAHISISHHGYADLSPNLHVPFITFSTHEHIFTLIEVNFSPISYAEKEIAFHNLSLFINRQDNPVILVGDFGVPSWSPLFINLLDSTGLSIKNKIILSDGKKGFSFFSVPSVNLLGYKNIGLEKFNFNSRNRKFDFKLTF